ncbi:MAG: hypothetical protein JWQ38_1989 [Flavipsychrobacter sp.]|nr:hypothetical protein [Flavipsychrobacter sp.]
MKILLVDLYKLIYRITNNSLLSIIVSLIYFTILNMVLIYGLSTLLPAAKALHILFKFPIYIITAVAMFLLNRWIMAPFKNIKKEKKVPIGYWGLIMYTAVAVIIYVYITYANALFQ